MNSMRRRGTVLVTAALAGSVLAACGAGQSDDSDDAALIVGTTDKVVSIDPAGSYDNGSMAVQTQVYQYLLNFPAGSTELTPDAAQECEFDAKDQTLYVCTMKDGLKFANGNELTASDVAFSFNRILTINNPNGPSALLGAMKKVEARDDSTVVFTLAAPGDQTFAQVLVTSAGPIVDEETYPADSLLDDTAAVEANGFSGPYTIGEYKKNELAEFTVNEDYDGTYGEPKSDVTMRYYADSNNLKLDVEKGDIDVAYRSLTPTDIDSLEKSDDVTVHTGPGGELRYIVFNLKTMPGEDEAQKQAVRQAAAYLVNRDEISSEVYKGTYTPAYSAVPDGQVGATEAFKDKYGDKPDKAAATKVLEDAGVSTPVTLNLQWNPDHYGSSSDQEYQAVKRQLEDSGLFTVNLQSTEWNTYSEERVKDAYPAFQLGWFPDFPDADNYLTPFFAPGNFLESHYEDPAMTKLLDAQRVDADQASREATLGQAQEMVAEQVPILPLLTGAQVAVAGKDVKGVSDTLDPSFKFRFASLSK
ncbi:ABC transporter substrate-binding protein [Aeromicrobium sp.]|uniref:ABC transporter substrate-binding protein n=1 Tax=Aeromicrobium sp. TaxID=1871063 RepID=UPI0028A906D3|nr:ABC transporter substrate-binding protein [Aeromicrobium sp.]